MVTPAGVEPATSSSASLRSIQLSYGAIKLFDIIIFSYPYQIVLNLTR